MVCKEMQTEALYVQLLHFDFLAKPLVISNSTIWRIGNMITQLQMKLSFN